MRILLLLVVLIAIPAIAKDVYRWVDEKGQAHYSDQWQPGAEKIHLQETPGYSAPPVTQSGSKSTPAKNPPVPGGRYETLEIASPAQEEVLWNIAGQLRVSLRVNPPLRPGHNLHVYLDGKQQEVPGGSTDVQIPDVFRGIHTLRAEVVDGAGTKLIESPTTSFAVRQTSLANPSKPAP